MEVCVCAYHRGVSQVRENPTRRRDDITTARSSSSSPCCAPAQNNEKITPLENPGEESSELAPGVSIAYVYEKSSGGINRADPARLVPRYGLSP